MRYFEESLIKGLFRKLWAEMKETVREPQVGGTQSAPHSSWVLGWEREPGEWIAWTLSSLSPHSLCHCLLLASPTQKAEDKGPINTVYAGEPPR